MPLGVLVPVDLSPSSESALRWALDQVRLTGQDVVVLHVVHEPNPLYEPSTSGRVGTVEEAAGRATEAFVARIAADSDVAIQVRVVHGLPAPRILEAIEQGAFAHVVMGAHGQEALGEFLLGSKAELVARRSRVPVTIVRA